MEKPEPTTDARVPFRAVAGGGDGPSRRRLPPQERSSQILDAALQEFAARGFAATRIDDIARRGGLSKGGVYAHFDSKEAIFQALLERALRWIDWDEMPQPGPSRAGTRALAEWIVDRLHAALLNPAAVVLLRLLVAERERVPRSIDQWRDRVTRMRAQRVAALIRERLGAQVGIDNLLLRHPWLALSPVMHVLLWQALFGPGSVPDSGFRAAHVELLCQLLGEGSAPAPV
ncbi:MAG TPA: TetR/AcrR family transcriptional regulator [Ottowia sp.]|uniref:TetR/AcrR family transcriptional regulator n=1 Tax=Ottowia sp. TaxID=1898956 RepID=UPI002CB78DA6|nr:TetR/AcrR family transcriptional regulator [Ottowia sp.]HMN21150.1 TetR/AcrR family transcriptional regulator [Ottowia sp.]